MPRFDEIYFEQEVRAYYSKVDKTKDVVLIRLASLLGEILQC